MFFPLRQQISNCSINTPICVIQCHTSVKWDCAEDQIGLFQHVCGRGHNTGAVQSCTDLVVELVVASALNTQLKIFFKKHTAFIFSGQFVLNAEAVISD